MKKFHLTEKQLEKLMDKGFYAGYKLSKDTNVKVAEWAWGMKQNELFKELMEDSRIWKEEVRPARKQSINH